MKRSSPTNLLFVLISLIWLIAGCGGPQPVVVVTTPSIGEPKVGAPSPQQPGEEIGISIEIASTGGATLTYTWTTDGGEIMRGQGSPAITYRVPQDPGTYNIRVKVEWEGQSIEKVTSVKVEGQATAPPTSEPPTDTPQPSADTATPKPTNTPKPPTATPTPKATSTPKPTNTPRPTPLPTATIDADPTVYDNFNNPANDGSFNQSQWQIWSDPPNQIFQQDGILIVTQDEKLNSSTALKLRKYDNINLNTPSFFEAKLKMDPVKKAGWVYLWIDFSSSTATALAACRINQDVQAFCEYVDTNSKWDSRYETEYRSVGDGQFHTFRIDIDPDTMAFTYYLDGQMFGSYTPVDADKFKSRPLFILNIGVANWEWNSTEAVVGYFDNVRIGQIGQ